MLVRWQTLGENEWNITQFLSKWLESSEDDSDRRTKCMNHLYISYILLEFFLTQTSTLRCLVNFSDGHITEDNKNVWNLSIFSRLVVYFPIYFLIFKPFIILHILTMESPVQVNKLFSFV